jgi:hypothetical protein
MLTSGGRAPVPEQAARARHVPLGRLLTVLALVCVGASTAAVVSRRDPAATPKPSHERAFVRAALARGPGPLPGGTTEGTVELMPGEDLETAVAAADPGTTFVVKAGVHRLQTIRPKDGQTFLGEPGAVLSGARLLTRFGRAGALWVATGQTQEGVRHGECRPEYPRCGYAEQLFIDDQPLLQVSSIAEVRSGRWFFDYGGDRIYFADDPTGRKVEASVTATAIDATADGVTVSNLTVEKYANPAQKGAVSGEGRTGWKVSANEVRWNHGVGIRVGSRSSITANFVHHNGHDGIVASGEAVLVEANEIAYNNAAHFDPGWEGGGAKFVGTRDLVVRGNLVHHNDGPGLWTDGDNIDVLYERNECSDNARMGIFHEISYRAVIRDNIVRRNGLAFSAWLWGAGILVANSSDVEIYGNTVEENADGIGGIDQKRTAGRYGPHALSNLSVHDNTVAMRSGWTGIVQDTGDDSVFVTRGNRFSGNRYRLGPEPWYFVWQDAERSESEWKLHGQDREGTFDRF